MSCRTLAFVGRSGSGKTSLILRLIPEFIKLNLRVGTLKHTHHIQSFDQPEKDSWKHRQAGSEQTVVLSDKEIGIFSAAPPWRSRFAAFGRQRACVRALPRRSHSRQLETR